MVKVCCFGQLKRLVHLPAECKPACLEVWHWFGCVGRIAVEIWQGYRLQPLCGRQVFVRIWDFIRDSILSTKRVCILKEDNDWTSRYESARYRRRCAMGDPKSYKLTPQDCAFCWITAIYGWKVDFGAWGVWQTWRGCPLECLQVWFGGENDKKVA